MHERHWLAPLLLTLWALAACVTEKERGGLRQDATEVAIDLDVDLDVDGDATGDDGVEEIVDDVAAETVTGDLPSGAECNDHTQCLSRRCFLGRNGRRCAFTCGGPAQCPGDTECRPVDGEALCVDRHVAFCMPCRVHGDCNLGGSAGLAADRDANRCLSSGVAAAGDGRFCGVACGVGFGDCSQDAECVDGQCRPSAGSCTCSAAAVALEADTTCSVAAGDGALCTGTRRCDTRGAAASACDAPTPEAERCNGLDDDCDGVTDDRPLSPDCSGFACLGADGCGTRCAVRADCEPGLGCDRDDRDGDQRTDECIATGEDGTACHIDSACDSGYCANDRCCDDDGDDPICCAEDADCAALDGAADCTDAGAEGCIGLKIVGRCHGAICVADSVPSAQGCVGQVCRGAQCLTGGVLDGAHLCDGLGACAATEDQLCDDADPCTDDGCDADAGCLTTPRSGVSDDACYGFDDATRGVGRCADGKVICQNGAAIGCSEERGPVDELCNDLDDDCDGATDEDTEVACFPYVCGGLAGCAIRCGDDGDCAAGNFCADAACVGGGDNGAVCGDDSECASGHCDSGICCEAGICCVANSDCASVGFAVCDGAAAGGCSGYRVDGICGPGAMCTTADEVADPSVCDLEECAPAVCFDGLLFEASLCSDSVCQESDVIDCSPYACGEGACLDVCGGDEDCVNGAVCTNGQCASLPDGAACMSDTVCASGYCSNGYCCDAGDCCQDDSDCGGLDQEPECLDPELCIGDQVIGVCGPDHYCVPAAIGAPAACLGEVCGDSECVNLEGGSFVMEGIERQVCNAAAECVAAVSDCRDAGAAECASNTALYALGCNNCLPDRTTCVVFSTPCRCE